MKLGDNKLVASPPHGANIAALALAGPAWVWRGTANLALRTVSKTQGAGPMKTLAAATVVVVALTCGTAATADRMADAYKTCEHLLGFPTCYGACTLWYTSDEPWENEELVKRSETCYAKDRGWEGFRPPEEVVVTGTRRRITITVTIRGTTDGDADPVEDVVGGGGSGSGGSRDDQTNQPADNPPQCPATETEGINAPENCVCPQGHVKTEGRAVQYSPFRVDTYWYCKAPYTPPPGGIDSTTDAVRHYYRGNGATVEVSDSVKDTIEAVSEVREALRGLAAGTADRGALHETVKLSVNMTSSVYYIGDTHIYYYTGDCKDGWCDVWFTWGPDRFEEPLDVPGLEVGGTPYHFTTHQWKDGFRDPNPDQGNDSGDD